jgi:hypothetical protein
MVREKLPTFQDFAKADLAAIYTDEKLAAAVRFEVNSLESGILVNESSGSDVRFQFRPLPRIAQASPIFGCLLVDVDQDGNLDLYVVQNFYGPQRETGYMDGGVSLLLAGDGQGNFVPVDPARSGLVVTGDAKSLTATDLNHDGKVDFVIGKNNDGLVAFVNQTTGPSNVASVRQIIDEDPSVGAKIYVTLPNGGVRLHEVTAGSGYLSQSSPLIFGGTVGDVASPATLTKAPH